ncbi:hypothetical protein Nit79A3_2750 [Nitrosomonas sp. Is79A3]|uniref:methylamine utilization protein MauJ n=1 Tax=Nitrosomonas sp. (strain Is79A3) TaxID=261292 RepID=UPI000215D20D
MKKIHLGPEIPHIYGDQITEKFSSHHAWLIAAVHYSISWPEKTVLLQYDKEDYFLTGLNEDNNKFSTACVIVRLSELHNDAALHIALKKVYRFTSILGWFVRGYVDVVGYITGSRPILYSLARTQMSIMTMHFNCNFMPLIRDKNIWRALAFWREGLRLSELHESYSFLSFYKVIESQFNKDEGKARGAWINNSIIMLTGKAADRVRELQSSQLDLGKHIFDSGRCAVAHASLNSELIDPDNPADRIRIAKDIEIVRSLAEKYICEELGVPNETNLWK